MQISCRSCGAKIPAEDVNIDRVLAKCRQCQAVFDFSDQVQGAPAAPNSLKARFEKGDIDLPKNLTIEEFPNSLLITRRWQKGPGCFFLFFSVFWNSIVSVFLVLAISGKMKGAGPFPGFIFLFLTPFVLVGIGTAWAALALLLNRTTIRVGDGRLEVRSAPIRWPGNCSIETAEIEQLYCQQYVAYSQNHVPQYRLALWAQTKGGGKTRIARGIEEPEQALYLEHLLEKHLGIADRPVREEFRG